MATPFKFDTKQHGNINDSGIKSLPLGKHNYVITKITYVPVKADTTGKRHQLVIELRHSEGGKFTQFIEHVPRDKSDNEAIRARIAAEEFNAYVQACGFDGVLTPAKFTVLYNKVIGIETVKTVNKATKKEYTNVNQIVKKGFPDAELSPLGASNDDAPDEDEDEDEDEAEEEEEEETPPPVKKKKAAPAPEPVKKKKAAPAPVEEEDEDKEEEEEDDDEEESEDDDEDPFA